jgi:HD superfamily phosphohydrolase YqeK
MSNRAQSNPYASLPEAVAARLTGRGATDRWNHVRSVANTVEEIGTEGDWPEAVVKATLRAAWYHDALKADSVDDWLRWIAAVDQEPDSWAATEAPKLLHAHAAAAWAVLEWSEQDEEVLTAVRHHPTGHPDWGTVGWLLYVADFCEPLRNHSAKIDTASLIVLAGQGPTGLEHAAARVLSHRVHWMVERGRAVHPLSLAALAARSEGEPC